MSTERTKHFELHIWDSGDDFLLSEINENFGALDDAARVVMGTYDGDGTVERVIQLGFTPQAVLLENEWGQRVSNLGGPRGGLVFPGFPGKDSRMLLTVVEGGFQVSPEPDQAGTRGTNSRKVNYRYIALY